MGTIGLPEMLIILCILVLIFGANRLPELGRGLGKGIRSFKDATRQGMKEEEAAKGSQHGGRGGHGGP